MAGIEQLLHFARICEDLPTSEGRQLARGGRSGSRIGVSYLRYARGPFLCPFSRHELQEVENFCGNWFGKSGCLCLELLRLGHGVGYVVKK
jgi:hypothetical protein